MSVTTLDIPISETTQPWRIPLLTVFVLWVLVLFDPHIWISQSILGPIPKYIYLALAIMVVLQAAGRVWYPPLLFLVASGLIASAFAENIGVAQDLVIKILLLYYILAIGSLTFITSVDRMTLILHLFLWQFLWWSFHGGFMGRVPWHPTLGNEDGFGPVMVIGMGYCFFFGMATRNRNLRLTAFLLSGLCVVGVVNAFARGAVLAAGFVVAYMWFRSKRKGQTFAVALVGVVVFLLATTVFFPAGEFWQEMSTASEGFESGTGLDRWILWNTAWDAFLERPIFGVGAGNFGIFASAHLWSPDLGGIDALGQWFGYRTHWHFYGRSLHSVYFQVLSEFGLVGTIAFVALLIDFWKRNAQLRSAPLVNAWWSATGHRFDLGMLSRGLEAAMVAFLANGFFYDQFYVHWFFSILTVNALMYSNARRVVVQQHPHMSQ